MTRRPRSGSNFWYFVLMFLAGTISTYFFSNAIPRFDWNFLAIILPVGFAVLVAITSGLCGKWDEGKEFTIASFGAAVGGGFALYILPLVVR